MATFAPTHTINGTPVQMWHSRNIHGPRGSVTGILTCYDANRQKYQGDEKRFIPIAAK
jgi:hypothetical protein